MTRYALASSGGALHIFLYNAQATPQSRRLNTAGDIQQPFLVLVITVAITIVTVVAVTAVAVASVVVAAVVVEYGIACTLWMPEALHQMQLAGDYTLGESLQINHCRSTRCRPVRLYHGALSAAKIHHS